MANLGGEVPVVFGRCGKGNNTGKALYKHEVRKAGVSLAWVDHFWQEAASLHEAC